MFLFLSPIDYYCDNLEIVHKVNTLATNPNAFDERYKTTDHDAVLQFKLYLSPNIFAFNVKGRQDKRKKWEELTIPERLIIQADKLIGDKAKAPLNQHIIQTSIAIYVHGKYIPNNYVNSIRTACGEKGAKDFLINRFQWAASTIANIEWDIQAKYIKKQTYTRKKTLLNFIHRWLASGNKNFEQKLMCPYCNQQENKDMDHDQFLTCSSSGTRKQRMINLYKNFLHSLDTPHELTTLLIHGFQSLYNSQLTNTHASDHKAINHQRKIGWDNFSRGRISKQFIITMNEHYKQTQRTSTFTGIGWIKQIVNLVLSTHIDEWYHRCESNSNLNQISFQNTLMSIEKKSMLITIEFVYSKAEILPVNLKIWFQSSLEEFKKYNVKRLKQWIANTKKLFKIHKKNHNYDFNKITEYFVRIGETTKKQLHKTSNFPLPNNNVPDYTPSQKQYISKNSAKFQFLSEQTFENNTMSTPDYLSYSTITSSSNTNYTVILTKK